MIIMIGFRKSKHVFFCSKTNKNVTVTVTYTQDDRNYWKQSFCGQECSYKEKCNHTCPKEYYEIDI